MTLSYGGQTGESARAVPEQQDIALHMVIEPLSIDISGSWSYRQTEAVLSVLEPELAKRHVYLERIEVTFSGDPYQRYVLVPYCALHGQLIQPDEACDLCLSGVLPRG